MGCKQKCCSLFCGYFIVSELYVIIMAQDNTVKIESVEALTKEADALKAKLEDERQKLNDVTCK